MRFFLSLLIFGAACESSAPRTKTLDLALVTTIDPGVEQKRCRLVQLPPGDNYVLGIAHKSMLGIHHLLLLRTDLTAIPPELEGNQDCDANNGAIMRLDRGVLYVAQEPSGEMKLADGVGIQMAPNAVLLMQAHVLNATTGPLATRTDAKLTLSAEPNPKLQSASVLLFYDPYIHVPAGGTSRAGARCPIPNDIKLLSVFSHYHSRGVKFEAYVDRPGQPPGATPFYESTDWTHPQTLKGGPLDFPAGTNLRFYCNYDNTDGLRDYVQGGSLPDSEMCVFTGLYYPKMDRRVEACWQTMNMFGNGSATCGATRACLESCPQVSDMVGHLAVDPCSQRCITASCPPASQPLFTTLMCRKQKCAEPCKPGGGDCAGCVAANCAAEIDACQSASCGD